MMAKCQDWLGSQVAYLQSQAQSYDLQLSPYFNEMWLCFKKVSRQRQDKEPHSVGGCWVALRKCAVYPRCSESAGGESLV